jgi:hypothetical protein
MAFAKVLQFGFICIFLFYHGMDET